MTNAQIILKESVKLMENGVISGTGNYMTISSDDGTMKQIEIPEEIHTFAGWKSLGYSVRKGQKSIAQFYIWKHTTKLMDESVADEKIAAENKEINERGGIQKMFMKKAFFFKFSQVETLRN